MSQPFQRGQVVLVKPGHTIATVVSSNDRETHLFFGKKLPLAERMDWELNSLLQNVRDYSSSDVIFNLAVEYLENDTKTEDEKIADALLAHLRKGGTK